MNCKECIHFEVCAYVSHYLQACDSYEEPAKHGKWIVNGRLWECSICGETTNNTCMGKPRANYCPNCGAKMVGKADEQE